MWRWRRGWRRLRPSRAKCSGGICPQPEPKRRSKSKTAHQKAGRFALVWTVLEPGGSTPLKSKPWRNNTKHMYVEAVLTRSGTLPPRSRPYPRLRIIWQNYLSVIRMAVARKTALQVSLRSAGPTIAVVAKRVWLLGFRVIKLIDPGLLPASHRIAASIPEFRQTADSKQFHPAHRKYTLVISKNRTGYGLTACGATGGSDRFLKAARCIGTPRYPDWRCGLFKKTTPTGESHLFR